MRRPLVALALFLAFPALAGLFDGPKAPKEILDKACADGAYIRPKKGTKPAIPKAAPKKKTVKTKGKDGKETEETASDDDNGGFAPAGNETDDMMKFTPKGDCSSFDKLFARDPKTKKSLSDDLEIAPASVDGKPLSPDEVSSRFVSLAGLSKLKTTNPEMVKRFFDGSVTASDRSFLTTLGAAGDSETKAMLGLDNAVQVGAPGPPREPLSMTESKKVKLDGKVPGLDDSSDIHPLDGPAPTPPAQYAPTEPGTIRRFYNNAKAEVIDWAGGSPIANAEGEREVLSNPTPIIDKPGSDQRVNVRVPEAPGLRPVCEPGCYGTQKMIALIVGMGADYNAYFKGERKISVGGVSKLGGGYFPPHVSHQHGIDGDFPFAKSDKGFDALANAMIVASVIRKMPSFQHINGREYILVDQSKHAAVGWGLDQLVAQKNLTPEQAARGKSVLVHWPNHNDHFHVRILP